MSCSPPGAVLCCCSCRLLELSLSLPFCHLTPAWSFSSDLWHQQGILPTELWLTGHFLLIRPSSGNPPRLENTSVGQPAHRLHTWKKVTFLLEHACTHAPTHTHSPVVWFCCVCKPQTTFHHDDCYVKLYFVCLRVRFAGLIIKKLWSLGKNMPVCLCFC